MKSLTYVIAALYVLFMISCTNNKNTKKNHSETINQSSTVDNHEGHEHQHENEADEHNHEEREHQTDNDDGHNHDTIESHATLNDADHAIITLKTKPFSTIFKTSGELLPAKGDELIVSALHSGIIRLQGNQLFDGKPINKGEIILNISGKEIVENNLQVHFLSAKAAFENAQKNFNRVKQLKNDTIVSEKEFFAAKLTFTKAKSEFQSVKRNYHKGAQKVLAPTQGFIKKLYVTDGQFVETGAPLFTISRNARLVLKAELSQEYISRISEIECARFKLAYTQQIFDTHDLNGQVISYGKTTAENSYYTPLFIEIDKVQQLIPGSYAEVFLRIHNEKEAIVIPRKALLEEQGQYYVFVKHNNEFEKRYVKLGESDGSNVEIVNGLRQNEQIATNEVYRIKLSQTGSVYSSKHNH